jgi:hypothetical protein
MHSAITLVSLFSLFAVITCQQQGASKPIKAIPNLELPSFLGRWFMVYASEMPQSPFSGASCVVEDLRLMNDAPASSFVPANIVSLDVDICLKYVNFAHPISLTISLFSILPEWAPLVSRWSSTGWPPTTSS